jgi:hypothetical protein
MTGKIVTTELGPDVTVTTKEWSGEDPRNVVVVNAVGTPALLPNEARLLGVLLMEAAAAAEADDAADDDWPAG